MATYNDTILSSLNWRYACKKFDPSKKISASDWATLEESLRLSPSSYGLQPWQFLVVQNPEVRKQLKPVSWNQPQIESCSHLVIVAHLKTMSEDYVQKYVQRVAQARGLALENLNGYRDMMVGDLVKGPRSKIINFWAAHQAYIAMGTFMTTAALLKIDTCPMEGIQPEKYDEILNLKDSKYTTVAVLAAGYRAAEDATQNFKKVRFEKKDIIKII